MKWSGELPNPMTLRSVASLQGRLREVAGRDAAEEGPEGVLPLEELARPFDSRANRRLCLALALSLAAHALTLYLVPAPAPAPPKPVEVLEVQLISIEPQQIEEAPPPPTAPPQPPVVAKPKPEPASRARAVERSRPTPRKPVAQAQPVTPPAEEPVLAPPAEPAGPPAELPGPVAALPLAAPAAEPAAQEPVSNPAPPAPAPSSTALLQDRESLRGYERSLSAAAAAHKQYPRIARVRGWQGTVQILVRIGPNGQVQDVQVAESSGYEVLDRQALDMVRKALSRQPPPPDLRRWYEVTIPIHFRLEERG